jgi:hypothetical protein
MDDELEHLAEATLRRAYIARADERQKAMGLSYIEAETRDLAKFIARFARQYHATCERDRLTTCSE